MTGRGLHWACVSLGLVACPIAAVAQTTYYLHAGGALDTTAPINTGGAVTFTSVGQTMCWSGTAPAQVLDAGVYTFTYFTSQTGSGSGTFDLVFASGANGCIITGATMAEWSTVIAEKQSGTTTSPPQPPVDAGANFLFSMTVTALSGTVKLTYDTTALPANVAGPFPVASDGGSLPTVFTAAASSLTSTSAVLNGSANPNGSATTAWFRYDTASPGTCNDSFGTSVPSPAIDAGSGLESVPFSQPIGGLDAGTTYYFCALANDAAGTGVGTVLPFTTTAADAGESSDGGVADGGAGDGGLEDSGAGDAGVGADGGASVDAGGGSDGGGIAPQGPLRLAVGCDCQTSSGAGLWLALVFAALATLAHGGYRCKASSGRRME